MTDLETKLADALLALLREYRLEFDSHDGRYSANDEPAAKDAMKMLIRCGYDETKVRYGN